MPSDSLYLELAKAYSLPSKTYRDVQQGLDAANESAHTVQTLFDQQRKRKLEGQTLGEVLGASAPTDTANIPIDQAEMLTKPIQAYADLLKAQKPDTPASPWILANGMFTRDNKPVQQNKVTGEVRPVDLSVVPTGRGVGGTQNTEWDTASDSEKALGKAVYEGRIRPSDLSFRDKGIAVKLGNEYARINNMDPMKSYAGEVAAKTAGAFAVGKPGMNALSLNTALGHSRDAMDAYDSIASTDIRFLNQPINVLKAQTNDPNVIKLQTTLNALSGELATVFKGSAGTDQDIGHWMKVLSQDLTPVQAKGAITQVRSLLNSRLSALDYQRKSGLSGRGEMPLLSPKVADVMRGQTSVKKTFQKTAKNAEGVTLGTNDNWATFEPVQ